MGVRYYVASFLANSLVFDIDMSCDIEFYDVLKIPWMPSLRVLLVYEVATCRFYSLTTLCGGAGAGTARSDVSKRSSRIVLSGEISKG